MRLRRSFPLVLTALALAGCAGAQPPQAPPKPALVVVAPGATVPDKPAPDEPAAAPAPACPPAPESAPLDADQKAACRYAELSKKIPERLVLERAIEGYGGSIDKVSTRFQADLEEAQARAADFEPLAASRDSRIWAILARIRQASLFEVLHMKLEATVSSKLDLYTKKEAELLQKVESSGDASLVAVAASIRQRREEQSQAALERWFGEADAPMVRHYAEALLWAKAWKIETAEIRRARERIDHYGELLGDQKMAEYTASLAQPDNQKPFVYSRRAFDAN